MVKTLGSFPESVGEFVVVVVVVVERTYLTPSAESITTRSKSDFAVAICDELILSR